MSPTAAPLGRRERNKQAKLERITAAAADLFARHGVDEVTTVQIAEAADIGTGTLFLYAKTKGELLLLVQNANYEQALRRGLTAASNQASALDAVMALVAPVIECNRVHVGNGRTYLREMVFGDATEPHHAEALAIVARTEAACAEILVRTEGVGDVAAATLARVVSAVLFVSMASGEHAEGTVEQVIEDVRGQVAAILSR